MCGGNATSYKRVEYLTLFFILYDIKFYYKFNIQYLYFILNLCAKFSLKSQPSIYGKYGKWIL